MTILGKCLYRFGRLVGLLVFLGIDKDDPESVMFRIQRWYRLLGVKTVETIKEDNVIISKVDCWFRRLNNPRLCDDLFECDKGLTSKLRNMEYNLLEKQTEGYEHCKFELKVK